MEVKPKLRALVIDDSRVMRNVVMDTLRKTELADFIFTEATDGSEAMSIFEPEKFDIIFADWNMPQLNGLEFARHIRSMRSAKHIDIVMVTSESAQSKQTKAYDEARITCYITKPFTVDEVRNKISPIVNKIINRQEEIAPQIAPLPLPPANNKPTGFFSRLLRKE
jgi:two-component system chemotaxis response regulator CheY